MLCQFTTHRTLPNGKHVHRCETCERESWATNYPPEKLSRKCLSTKSPSLAKRLSSYAKAVTRWKLAGSPKREPAEIERIYLEVCQPCERFKDGKCGKCGCAVNREPNGLRNKIAMATEHCPLEKW